MFEGKTREIYCEDSALDVIWNIVKISFYLVSCFILLNFARSVYTLTCYSFFPLCKTSKEKGKIYRNSTVNITWQSDCECRQILCPQFISSAKKKPTVYLNMTFFLFSRLNIHFRFSRRLTLKKSFNPPRYFSSLLFFPYSEYCLVFFNNAETNEWIIQFHMEQ